MANNRGVRWICLWWAFSVCVLCSSVAEASKRVYPRLNGPIESTGGLPSRNSGSLVTTNRLLHGQTILRDPRGPGRHMNLPANQGSFFSIKGITINAQGMFRRNLPAIVMGGAIAGIGYGLDWIFDQEQQQWMKEGEDDPIPVDAAYFHWAVTHERTTIFSAPMDACRYGDELRDLALPGTSNTTLNVVFDGSAFAYCRGKHIAANGTVFNDFGISTISRGGTGCPPDSSYDSSIRACVIPSDMVPITESDISKIEPEITGANPEFIQSVLRDACNGSNSPESCFESLMEKTELSGPSTVTTPSTTSTTTTTGPDGIAGTTTTTTNTTFNLTYGPNYYQYTTTTNTTTTKPDGTTETTEETDAPPFGEDPREPEEEFQDAPSPCTGDNCAGPAYVDLYTPSEVTKESVLDEYIARATQIPLFQAVTGFFDVSVSASCPVWSADIDFSVMGIGFDHTLLFDYHCQPWFTDYRPFAMAVFLVVGAFLAFRIAVL